MEQASLIGSLAAALLSLCSLAHTQQVDLCAIQRDPSQFCGKMITVRGTTWHGMESAGLDNDRCKTVLFPRPPEHSGQYVRFKLKRDESWQLFEHYDAMSSEIHFGTMQSFSPTFFDDPPPPPPPPNYMVTATFHGELVCRRKQRPWFFLVVQSVSDVKVEQVY